MQTIHIITSKNVISLVLTEAAGMENLRPACSGQAIRTIHQGQEISMKLVNLGSASIETKSQQFHSQQLDGAPIDEDGVLYRAANFSQNPNGVKAPL